MFTCILDNLGMQISHWLWSWSFASIDFESGCCFGQMWIIPLNNHQFHNQSISDKKKKHNWQCATWKIIEVKYLKWKNNIKRHWNCFPLLCITLYFFSCNIFYKQDMVHISCSCCYFFSRYFFFHSLHPLLPGLPLHILWTHCMPYLSHNCIFLQV